jgi:hypothetical protein
MQSKCSTCDSLFAVADKPSVRFAAAIGAAAGIVASRRMKGALLGSAVGYGMARMLGGGVRCPKCSGSDVRPVEV